MNLRPLSLAAEDEAAAEEEDAYAACHRSLMNTGELRVFLSDEEEEAEEDASACAPATV